MGRWGSNPRPADYESRPPAVVVMMADLAMFFTMAITFASFSHPSGMIKE
jgi:hypothetical protein